MFRSVPLGTSRRHRLHLLRHPLRLRSLRPGLRDLHRPREAQYSLAQERVCRRAPLKVFARRKVCHVPAEAVRVFAQVRDRECQAAVERVRVLEVPENKVGLPMETVHGPKVGIVGKEDRVRKVVRATAAIEVPVPMEEFAETARKVAVIAETEGGHVLKVGRATVATADLARKVGKDSGAIAAQDPKVVSVVRVLKVDRVSVEIADLVLKAVIVVRVDRALKGVSAVDREVTGGQAVQVETGVPVATVPVFGATIPANAGADQPFCLKGIFHR